MEREMTTVGGSAPASREALAVDSAHARRPGVPMEAEPHADPGASWDEPERQQSQIRHLKRKGLQNLTPVYGTAQPPKGLSGVIRRAAYEIPEHKPSHWALLMAADRVDVLEHGLTRLTSTSGPLPVGREVRRRPLLAVAAAGLVGVMLARAIR